MTNASAATFRLHLLKLVNRIAFKMFLFACLHQMNWLTDTYGSIYITNADPIGARVAYAPFRMIVGGFEGNRFVEFYLRNIPDSTKRNE